MRRVLLLLFFPLSIFAQQKLPLEQRIRKVENSLAPYTIYGDTLPKGNIEARMKETGIKAVSIAVIRNYKIEWAKAWGWADVESKRKATTNTRFQAASISKSINSMGVMKLVEKGKLDLDADINTYLKSWKFPYDSLSKGKKISMRHLLSHSAGLTIHGFPGYTRRETLPSVIHILNGEKANTKAVRSAFEPGKKFQYSGGGTTISQLIVADITGQLYDDYMMKEVLLPLGMSNSSYKQPPADTANLATGYYGDGQPVQGKYHVYPEQAAAGLWTTPTDLAKYIIECQLSLQGKSEKVLSKAAMQTRLTHYVDSSAALGVFINKYGTNKYFSHNGGNEAFLCTSLGSFEGGNGAVIMINGENFSVIEELLNSVAMVYDWKDFYKPSFKKKIQPPLDSMKLIEGDYLLGKDTISISFCGNELCIQQNKQPNPGYKVIFTDSTSFEVKEVGGAIFKVLYTDNLVEALELKQGGGTFKLNKVKQ